MRVLDVGVRGNSRYSAVRRRQCERPKAQGNGGDSWKGSHTYESLDYSARGSSGTSTASSWSAAIGTTLRTASLVEANTTGAATPSA